MSTHNKEALLIDAMLDVAAKSWLADSFIGLNEHSDAYRALRRQAHEEIDEVLAKFRRGLNGLPMDEPDDEGPTHPGFKSVDHGPIHSDVDEGNEGGEGD